jgi:hypothetical protein
MNGGRDRTAAGATRTHRTVLALAFAAVAVLLSTGFASGADGESVASFDAVVDVDHRGDLRVTETIAYVFGAAPRHGLRRELATRGDGRERPVSGVTASSPSGAPAAVQVTGVGGLTVVRVGDPTRTVTGRQTYVLRYTVAGAVDRVGTSTSPDGPPSPHDRLSWDVTGTGWDVPIDRVSVLVTAPRPATAAACRRDPGPPTGPCAGVPGPVSSFSAAGLAPGQGVTVGVAWPPGTATSPGPPPGPAAAEPAGPGPGGEAVGFALLVAVVVGLVALGRWFPTWAATDPTARPAGPAGPAPAAGRAAPRFPVTDLRAPGGLRPGQLATCRDGRADPVAVTATLVDLAVRGFLRIRAVPGTGGRRVDWLLIAASPPSDDGLLPYEETLRKAVLAGGESNLLRTVQRRHLRSTRRELVADAVEHGRLRDPGGEPFLRRMLRALDADAPLRRTPAGDALVEDMARFRAELAASDPLGVAGDEARTAFDRWLPHAVVLDMAQDWADRFPPVVGGRPDVRWYARSRRIADADADDVADGVVAFAAACDATSSDPGSSGSGGSGCSGFSDGFGGSGGFSSSVGSSSSDWSSGGGGGGGSSGGGSW